MGLAPAPLALIYDDLFLAHDQPGHPESAERLRAITRRLRQEPLLPEAWWSRAGPASEQDLLLVHAEEHLERVRRLCDRGGGWLDSDTYCGPDSFAVALGAVGATLEGLRRLTEEGGTPRALALVRPPGHHATPDRAMGFCLFNNVAVAARRAQQLGLERLAIVDLDVHHGNGTQEVFYEDGRVLYCSLHQWPLYPGTGAAAETGAGAGVGANINLPLAPGTGPGPWLGALRERVVPALERHRPQLLLVSCGYDALAGDPLAALELAPETYQEAAAMLAEVAQQTCQGRLLWLLEGGYDLEAMPEAVRRCALVLAGLSPSTLGEDAGATT